MKEPNKEKVKKLLDKGAHKDVPFWSTSDLMEAYEQLERLYVAWWRNENEGQPNNK